MRGLWSPLLLKNMLKEKAQALLDEALEQHPELFLIDFSVSADNRIKVILDGDKGVSLQDCVAISRAIEHNLDREEEDFSLEVASAGATEPLTIPRQYTKNVGRFLEVATAEGKIEAKLTEVGQDGITLEWKAHEDKPVGKGKVTVQKKKEIPFSEIEIAKVVLKF